MIQKTRIPFIASGVLIFVLCLAFLTELFCRSCLHRFYHGSDPYSFYYPKLRALKAIHPTNDTLKIGIFGSSVTSGEIIAEALEAELQNNIAQPVRVYNFSYIGGTIQDAWYMYKWAHEQKFWGLFMYHGVGEMRMNRYFQKVAPDFASISWFKRRQDVDRYYSPLFQTPCALAYMLTTWQEKQGLLYSRWNLGDSDYTGQSQSATNVGISAFSKTYRKFIGLASQRGERVFAGGLTFCDSLKSISFNTLVNEYNDSIKSVVLHNGCFIDFSALTNHAELFSDFYHLNEKGQLQFSHLLAQKIIEAYKRYHRSVCSHKSCK